MKINNPYLNKNGPLLSLVTTPIGNLDDITFRAINVLKEADIIACEDTRNTMLLLNHYQIKAKKLVSLYAQNELKNGKALLLEIKEKKLKLAYCSDAGMPGISDPGALLTHLAYEENIPVTIIPGPTASLSALIISNIDTADFSFFGFLPTKENQIKSLLKSLSNRKETLIFYESPKRVLKTLSLMREVFNDDREVSLIRELTKIHEEVINGTLKELTTSLNNEIKGECVIVVKGNSNDTTISDEELLKLIKTELKEGKSLSTISKELAVTTGVRKNHIYQIGLGIEK